MKYISFFCQAISFFCLCFFITYYFILARLISFHFFPGGISLFCQAYFIVLPGLFHCFARDYFISSLSLGLGLEFFFFFFDKVHFIIFPKPFHN